MFGEFCRGFIAFVRACPFACYKGTICPSYFVNLTVPLHAHHHPQLAVESVPKRPALFLSWDTGHTRDDHTLARAAREHGACRTHQPRRAGAKALPRDALQLHGPRFGLAPVCAVPKFGHLLVRVDRVER